MFCETESSFSCWFSSDILMLLFSKCITIYCRYRVHLCRYIFSCIDFILYIFLSCCDILKSLVLLDIILNHIENSRNGLKLILSS